MSKEQDLELRFTLEDNLREFNRLHFSDRRIMKPLLTTHKMTGFKQSLCRSTGHVPTRGKGGLQGMLISEQEQAQETSRSRYSISCHDINVVSPRRDKALV